MADDLNRLLIKIQADTSQLATALKQAESGVAQTSDRLERTLNKNSSKFRKWGDELAGQFKRLAAGYVGLEVVSKGLNAIDVVANLEDQAQAAGLTTDINSRNSPMPPDRAARRLKISLKVSISSQCRWRKFASTWGNSTSS